MALADHGFSVAVTARTEPEIRIVAADIERADGRAIPSDVTDQQVVGFGGQAIGLAVAIAEPFEELAYATVGVVVAKLFARPGVGFDRAADIRIPPGHEALLLIIGQPAIAARYVRVVSASSPPTTKLVAHRLRVLG